MLTDEQIDAIPALNFRRSLTLEHRRFARDVERATLGSAEDACMAIANDMRNHDVVRMAAAMCANAVRGLRPSE
jgi:hypothetical protein